MLRSLSSLSDKGLQICPKCFISLLKEKFIQFTCCTCEKRMLIRLFLVSLKKFVNAVPHIRVHTHIQLPSKEAQSSRKHILQETKSV